MKRRIERGNRLLEYLHAQHNIREEARKREERRIQREADQRAYAERTLQQINSNVASPEKTVHRNDHSSANMPVDPFTGKQGYGTKHDLVVCHGIKCDIDVINGQWYCRCPEYGYMRMYREKNSAHVYLKCDECANEYHFEVAGDLF
jgi:hypothetical protein